MKPWRSALRRGFPGVGKSLLGLFVAAFASVAVEPKLSVASAPVPTFASTATTLSSPGLADRIPECKPPLDADFLDRMPRNWRRVVPEDCQVSRMLPPQFVWTEPRDPTPAGRATWLRDAKKPFVITVRRNGVVVASKSTERPAASFSSRDAAWSAGDYTWTVTFVSRSGKPTDSMARRFRIQPGAIALDWPDGAALASKVAGLPFPRPLPAGQTFASIKARIDGGDYRQAWIKFEAQARAYLSIANYPPPREPVEVYRLVQASAESVAAGVALQSPMQNEQRCIIALAHAYRFTSDARFRDGALLRMRKLASWPVDNATVTDSDLDLVNRAIYRALAEGLDLLWDQIDPAERAAWIKTLRARMQPILKAFGAYGTDPYSSHLIGETANAVETLLHVAGMPGFPEAQGYLAEAWERYRFGFNVWGGEDGGFANSVAYGWYSLESVTLANAALRVIGGVDMASHPYFRRFGHFHMAFVAPRMDGLFLPFGDDTEMTKFFAWYVADLFKLQALLSQDAGASWYWRTHPGAHGNASVGKLSPWHFLLLGLDPIPVKPLEPQATAYVSTDAGIGALYSKMSDPARSALFLRSSRYGSVSHSHADQNAIAFDSHGQNLLISSGYYPWYGSAHHLGVTRLTRFKNALTIDGGVGQNETVDDPAIEPTAPGLTNYSMDNCGELVNFVDTPRWGVITGDASNAWRPRRRTFPHDYGAPMVDVDVRSAAYDRHDRIAVIYDHAHSPKPRRWELNFHALSSFDANGAGVRIDHKGVALCIEVYGPDGAFQSSKGFPIAPEAPYPSEKFPEQYHTRFSAARTSTDWTSVAVLREDCSAHKIAVRIDGSKSKVSIGGDAPVVFDGRKVALPPLSSVRGR